MSTVITVFLKVFKRILNDSLLKHWVRMHVSKAIGYPELRHRVDFSNTNTVLLWRKKYTIIFKVQAQIGINISKRINSIYTQDLLT